MKIHEYQARNLFAQYGIPVAAGDVAQTPEEALSIARKAGLPVVVKAQVLVGGRGKAGGVKVVDNEADLVSEFNRIKQLNIKGYTVERLLIAKAVDIRKEYYLAVTIDNIKGDVVVIACADGGVEIEETAKTHPERIIKFYMQGAKELDEARWAPVAAQLFDDLRLRKSVTAILQKLLKLFFEKDCSLAEINPFVINGEGNLMAVDAKVIIDDNALDRQPEAAALRDMKYEDPDELEAKTKGLSFVKLEGNVGCIVNGAGLAMGTMDGVNLLGGRPANFLDVGGSSNPEKVLNALKIILRNKDVKVILINIFGGITRCDDIANGILTALKQIQIHVPMVIRLTGTNEKEAKELLTSAGLRTFSSMRQAVTEAVKATK
ncbi:MAG: ADP-forming succinate--CoA ligase subunit beta [Candidatus Omnitrophica bacterium]|nr:ADP-forming succinate--CoA ligase subunit beta [Candidatus Omnitrophota bacterium]MDE2231693.1 ADP-forming succinate--CoA ligase subunit beta [Candidatus Omnitrophota bacterium]